MIPAATSASPAARARRASRSIAAALASAWLVAAPAARGFEWTDVSPESGSAPLPGRGQHAFECTIDGTLYVFGGAHWVTVSKERTFEFLGDFWHRAPGGQFEDLTLSSACPIPPTIEPHFASDRQGRLYEFGGIQGSLDGWFSNRLYRYDPATNAWTDLTPADSAASPPGREDHGFVGDWTRNVLWVYGGVTQTAVQLGDLWRYDVAAERWELVEPVPGESVPIARELYDLVWDGRDALYLFGGYADDVGYLNDFWRYDIPSNRWTDLTAASGSTAITPRSYAGMAADDRGIVWLAGGYGNGQGMDGFWRYDPTAGVWTELEGLAPPELLPRATFNMVYAAGEASLYLLGGLITPSLESKIYRADTWRFDLHPVVTSYLPPALSAVGPLEEIDFDLYGFATTGRPLSYEWYVDGVLVAGAGADQVHLGPFCPGARTVVGVLRDGALRDSVSWTFTVAGEAFCGASRLSIAAAPTLATGDVSALLWQPAAGSVRIDLVDASGRTVRRAFDGFAPSALTRVPIPTAGLPAGVYALRASAAGGSAAARLVVLR